MPSQNTEFILEYLSFLQSVNSQWENESLKSHFIEKSNSEIATGTLSPEQNWPSANKVSVNKEFEYVSLPFLTQYSDAIGRHFVSSRNIEAGEVLLIEPPAVLAPLVRSPLKNSQTVCIQCLNEVISFTCPNCGMFLCGKECDVEDHKGECLILRSLGLAKEQRHVNRLRDSEFLKKIENLPGEERLAAVIMVERATSSFMKSNKERILKYYPLLASLKTLQLIKGNSLFQNFITSLQGNITPSSNQFIANTQRIVNPLVIELKLPYSHDFLHKIASVWDTNGFEVKMNKVSSGQGLYPASSFLTHSCLPNCEHMFTTKGVMVLRAVNFIPKDTILTICYTDLLWPTQVRVDHLMNTKNFQCKCNRCLDPTEFETFTGSALCLECQGYLIEEQTDSKLLRCQRCSKHFNKKEILRIEARLSGELSQFSVISFQDVREKIDSVSNIFHSRHHLILRLKFGLLKKLKTLDLQELNDEEIEAAYSLTSSLLDAVTKLFPKYSCQRAQVTKAVFRILKEKSRREGNNHQEVLTPEVVSVAKLVLGWFDQTMDEPK